jgi:antirestriction protein ArdC
MKADALMEKVKGWLEELERGLREGHTGDFLSFLEGMGRFHQYSARNVMLILMQRPSATLVAGIKRWNELGRRVKKGERGIAILAPITKTEVEEGEDGTPVKVEKLIGFRTAYVFDVSQTEGEPLSLGKDIPRGTELYARLCSRCPVPVEERLTGSAMGYTNGKRIVISAMLSPTAKAETLLHEWAHTRLHFDGVKRPAEVEELEAEAVAYAVGRELGLPMSTSRDYILHWHGTVEGLEAALERIQRAAREILERFHAAEPVLAAA